MLSKKGKEKIHAIKSTNEFKQKMHNIISSDKVQRKTKQTNFERYGEISPMRCAEIRKKIIVLKHLSQKIYCMNYYVKNLVRLM